MKQLKILSFLCLPFLLSFITPDRKQKTGEESPVQDTIRTIRAFLGHSDRDGGQITKPVFDSLLKQGLTARDSFGGAYPVDGFTFSYAERNLYQDSLGKLVLMTDFYTEYCPGDRVSPAIANNLYDRTKAGDTAYFDNVKVKLRDGGQMITKPLKFILVK